MFIALDKEYRPIKKLLTIYDMSWTRRYYDRGQFLIVIDAKEYNSDMKFIYNQKTEELAEINKIDITDNGYYASAILEGYFIENKLYNFITYPTFKQKGITETIVKSMVSTYSKIKVAPDQKRGKSVDKDITGDNVGVAIKKVLQVQELAFKLDYDFVTNEIVFDVWQGKDRTSNQDVNSRCVFSKTNKNIKNSHLLLDNSNYRNVCVVKNLNDNTYTTIDISKTGEEKKYIYTSTYSTTNDKQAIEDFGREYLLRNESITNIDAEYQPSKGYTYRKDFDLGDKVELVVEDFTYTARIIEIKEVYKNNEQVITLVFGNKIRTIKDEIKEVNN